MKELIAQLKAIAGLDDSIEVRTYYPPADVTDGQWVLDGVSPRRRVCWDSWDGQTRYGASVQYIHGDALSLAMAEVVLLHGLIDTIAWKIVAHLLPGGAYRDMLVAVHEWSKQRWTEATGTVQAKSSQAIAREEVLVELEKLGVVLKGGSVYVRKTLSTMYFDFCDEEGRKGLELTWPDLGLGLVTPQVIAGAIRDLRDKAHLLPSPARYVLQWPEFGKPAWVSR